uniref:Odorant-binding protein 4 n=1 Tax=Matsumurasca onukii TaxID=2912585 RepID=A0A343WGZ5_MATON|nr:odorant-binding protein 4 [Matsumurasca onukii]
MISFVVVALVLAAITLAQAKLDKKESIDLINKCKKETGATEDAEQLFETQVIPETPKGKCLMQCVMREQGLMKENKIDAQAISQFFEKTYADDPEQLEKAAAAVAKCSLIDVKGQDKCDVAVAYLKCGQKNESRL